MATSSWVFNDAGNAGVTIGPHQKPAALQTPRRTTKVFGQAPSTQRKALGQITNSHQALGAPTPLGKARSGMRGLQQRSAGISQTSSAKTFRVEKDVPEPEYMAPCGDPELDADDLLEEVDRACTRLQSMPLIGPIKVEPIMPFTEDLPMPLDNEPRVPTMPDDNGESNASDVLAELEDLEF